MDKVAFDKNMLVGVGSGVPDIDAVAVPAEPSNFSKTNG